MSFPSTFYLSYDEQMQIILIIMISATLVAGTACILGIYSLVVLFLLLFSKLLKVSKIWLNK